MPRTYEWFIDTYVYIICNITYGQEVNDQNTDPDMLMMPRREVLRVILVPESLYRGH